MLTHSMQTGPKITCAAAALKRKREWDVKYTKGDIAAGCIRFTVLQKKNKIIALPEFLDHWNAAAISIL